MNVNEEKNNMNKNQETRKHAKATVIIVSAVLIITFLMLANISSEFEREARSRDEANSNKVQETIKNNNTNKPSSNNSANTAVDKEDTSGKNETTSDSSSKSESLESADKKGNLSSSTVDTDKTVSDKVTEGEISKLPNKVKIVDKCGQNQLQVIDEFYKDNQYIYYFNTQRSTCTYVTVNGADYTVKFALNNKLVTMEELEKAGFSCLKKKNNLVTE